MDTHSWAEEYVKRCRGPPLQRGSVTLTPFPPFLPESSPLHQAGPPTTPASGCIFDPGGCKPFRSPIPPPGDGWRQDRTGRKRCRRQGVWNLLGPGTPGTSRAARTDGRGALGAPVPGVHHPAELARKNAPRGASCTRGVSHPLGLPFTLQPSLQPRTPSPRPPLNLGRFLLPLGKPPSRGAGSSASQTATAFTRCLATLAGPRLRGCAGRGGNLEHVTLPSR